MRSSFSAVVKRFGRDERGASMVEYAILVGLITAALVTAINTLGTNIGASFTAISTVLSSNQAGR
jgi:pilus assembly protein Flp/PilA